jgi:hypothetical protein
VLAPPPIELLSGKEVESGIISHRLQSLEDNLTRKQGSEDSSHTANRKWEDFKEATKPNKCTNPSVDNAGKLHHASTNAPSKRRISLHPAKTHVQLLPGQSLLSNYFKTRRMVPPHICIITAYWVFANKYTGPKTAYQHQRRQLSAMFRQVNKVVDPDPNRQFILDLQGWISYIQMDGAQVILSLDNNDELNPASRQVVKLSFNPVVPTTST